MKNLFLFLILLLSFTTIQAQVDDSPRRIKKLFEIPDTTNKARLWGLTGGLGAGYTGVVIGLNNVWYAQYDRTRFQFFNDMGEWQDMDKMGHMYTAYIEGKLAMQMYRWTGIGDRKSAYTGAAIGTGFQLTLEMLDAFSEKWGFSWGDIAFNTAGSLIFLGQELAWQEQRITLKLSSWRRPTDDITIVPTNGGPSMTLIERRNELYGSSYAESILKDYNALTIWASVNVHSFIKKENSKYPKWLNFAVGYGAENMYEGFGYEWTKEDEETGEIYTYNLNRDEYPRYRQFFFSIDIDFSKIKTKSKFVNGLFQVINIIKIPAPAIEFNTNGQVRFHAFYF